VPHVAAFTKPLDSQTRLFTAATFLITLVGLVVAAIRPPQLVDALAAAVAGAGPVAPIAFVALCAVLAPFHLSGVLVVLSPLFWPISLAAALSFAGVLAGSLLTAALLARIGVTAWNRDGWPGWLRRLSSQVARRPLLVGVAARLIMNTGIALEAFYLLTGYTRRQYLLVTTVGTLAWVIQTLIGVSVLSALIDISIWYGAALVVAPLLPLLLIAVVTAWRRRPTS
jgi:hypothetical protein